MLDGGEELLLILLYPACREYSEGKCHCMETIEPVGICLEWICKCKEIGTDCKENRSEPDSFFHEKKREKYIHPEDPTHIPEW